MGLARLGVKKLILVDYECVELPNLNRQVLFSQKHIGTPKAKAAEDVLRESHILNPAMEIESYNFDVLKKWPEVVRLAQESTVVFNMIDVGEYFDMAVQSLCTSLKRLLISGGNFSQQICVDSVKPGEPCLLCASLPANEEAI